MTIAEVAQLIGKSEQSVRRAIKSGKIKAVMVEGRYEIDETDIPDSLRDSQAIVTDSQDDSQTDSHALVTEIENLKERITELEAKLSQKDSAIAEARREAAEASQRHDTVVMQMTRLLEYERQPFWRRWWGRQKQLPEGVQRTEE